MSNPSATGRIGRAINPDVADIHQNRFDSADSGRYPQLRPLVRAGRAISRRSPFKQAA
jgi:hypothetical protein